MKIDQDAWDDWLGSPVTEAVMQWAASRAREQQALWLKTSWDGGKADPITLARFQERAQVFEEIATLTRQAIEADE